MAVDKTPWATGDTALQHTADTARVLAYAGTGGGDGVVSPDDCKVKALSTPGSSVRIGPGAIAGVNRTSGALSQSFVGRVISDTAVPISATGAGSGRSDLICMVFRDPTSGAGGTPGGDGFVPIVVSGVPSTATKLQDQTGHQFTSGYALARVDIPASTAAITAGMVKDLRELVAPRQRREVISIAQGGARGGTTLRNPLTSSTFVNWPPSASLDVFVPEWATHAIVVATISGFMLKVGDSYGEFKVTMSGQETVLSAFDENWTGTPHRGSATIGGTIELPVGSPGTADKLRVMARRAGSSNNGVIDVDGSSSTIIDVQFVERIR